MALYMCVFGNSRHLSKTWSSKFCWFDAKLNTSTLPGNLKKKTKKTKKTPKPTRKQPTIPAFVLPNVNSVLGTLTISMHWHPM